MWIRSRFAAVGAALLLLAFVVCAIPARRALELTH
jgi:hypothetical protein